MTILIRDILLQYYFFENLGKGKAIIIIEFSITIF